MMDAGWRVLLARRLCLYALLHILMHSRLASAVRCYCTEKSCEPFGYCEAMWCVVGIRKSTGSVIRSCGTEQAYLLRICRRDLGDWQDLCACGDELCNSYAYLRTQIRHNRFMNVGGGVEASDVPQYVRTSHETSPHLQPDVDKVEAEQAQAAARYAQQNQALLEHLPGVDTSRTQQQQQRQQADPVPPPPPAPDEDAIVFSRNDPASGGSGSSRSRYGKDGRGRRRKEGDRKGIVMERNSLLVVLLVVVPLGIGALSVLIVASNYYCQLC